MAFIIPRSPVIPSSRFSLALAPGKEVLRAHELLAFVDAQQLFDAALAQAKSIVLQAETELESERKRGYEEGLDEIRMEQAEGMMETVTRTVDYFSKVESRMVDLVMQAVRKIVLDFDDGDRVVNTVKNMLSVVRNQKQMTLRLNPQQVESVRARINELLSEFPGVGYLDIVADSRLKPDACILESEIGLVEGSLESQLEALRNAFNKVIGSRI